MAELGFAVQSTVTEALGLADQWSGLRSQHAELDATILWHQIAIFDENSQSLNDVVPSLSSAAILRGILPGDSRSQSGKDICYSFTTGPFDSDGYDGDSWEVVSVLKCLRMLLPLLAGPTQGNSDV